MIDAIHETLARHGRRFGVDEVHVLSGAAFRWVHLDDDGFDAGTAPLPVDVVALGLSAGGLTGHVESGRIVVDRVEEPPPYEQARSAALGAAHALSRPSRDPVPQGPEAYEAVIEDLLLGRRFVEGKRLERLETSLGRLVKDRRAASGGLVGWEGFGEAARKFGQVAGLAEKLVELILCRDLGAATASDAIASRVENGSELAYAALLVPSVVLEEVRREGIELIETPGGPVLVADDPERRGRAARLAAEIRDLDAEAFALFA